MGRKPEPAIRAALRERAVDYVLSHGFTDLSLRPLAKALHTNARMIVYHFGSREGLMRAILEGLREREDARIDSWFKAGRRARTMAEFLRWYWCELSQAEARSAICLIFELYALALRRPSAYPGVLENPVAYWQKLTDRCGLRRTGDEEMATLLLAATRGLLLDLTATGEKVRIDRAFSKLLGVVDAISKPRNKPRATRAAFQKTVKTSQ